MSLSTAKSVEEEPITAPPAPALVQPSLATLLAPHPHVDSPHGLNGSEIRHGDELPVEGTERKVEEVAMDSSVGILSDKYGRRGRADSKNSNGEMIGKGEADLAIDLNGDEGSCNESKAVFVIPIQSLKCLKTQFHVAGKQRQ
jgi:hypothetical protein